MAGKIQRNGCIPDARMKALEEENRRLKKMYAEEKFKSEIAREAIEKK